MNEVMKKLKYILFCLLLLIQSACKHDSDCKDILINVVSDTVNISIQEEYLETYTTLRNIVAQDLLYCYNNKLHTIDIFELTKQKPEKIIHLEREGVDGVVYPQAITVYKDSVFIQNSTHYLIVNHNGKVIWKLAKKELNNQLNEALYSFSSTGLTICNFEDLVYDNNRRELIVPLNALEPTYLGNKNMIAAISIDTKTAQVLPLFYPETVTNGYYGKLAVPQIFCKGDSLIYNFPNSSTVYIFDRNSEKVTTLNVESEYTDNQSEKIGTNTNPRKLMDHFLHSLFFHKIQYDKERNLYYRLHTDRSSDRSAFSNKDTYLTIMNERLEKISEIKLPMNIYPMYNITKDGLLFQFIEVLEEDTFSYLLITTDKIKKVQKPLLINVPCEEQSKNVQQKVSKSIETKTEKQSQSIVKKMNVQEIRDFFEQQMIYPEQELKNRVEGVVMVSFSCDKKGKVITRKILEQATTTDNENLRKEALRLANLVEWVEPGITYMVHIPFNVDLYLDRK